MSILDQVFNLTKEEQIALLGELEQKANSSPPIALPKEVIDTFELPPEVDIEKELATIKETVLAEVQAITINAPKGDKGDKGAVGPQGPKGIDGVAGKDGKPGVDGKDGKDGISVTDARVDFDGSLVITLSDGKEINAGDVIPNDKKELVIQSLKNGALSLIELGIEDYLSSPTPIGDVTPNTGAFTSVTTPSITATTDNLTLSASGTGVVNINTTDGTGLRLSELAGGTVTAGLGVYSGTSSQNTVYISPYGTAVNPNLYLASKGTGNIIFATNTTNSATGTQQFQITNTASAVNYVQVTGAATSANPVISAQGSDATVNLSFQRKGNGNFQFLGPVILGSNGVNYWQTSGAATTLVPQLQVLGSDTNISMAFQPKGTGAINLAAGSKGVNISNGGTVTAITRTVAGTGYTSPPSLAISAPTTAGGVQATASTFLQLATTPTITSGGTGYTVGNVLTFVGGTIGLGANAAQVTVTSVSSGVITGISITTFGTGYSTVPTNPISVTGGTGTGATFTVSGWQIAGFTITNAGSGYVEQPTVTFSGGGGSGAAAYATVGGNSIVRGLGSTTSFYTPGGEAFRLVDNSQTSNSYWGALGSSANSPSLRSFGASTANIDNNAAAGINFRTNLTSSSAVQMFVGHTASAVNYVQVTGSATGSGPTISTQGSDTNAFLAITSKGTSAIRLQTGGTSQVLINNTTSAINQLGLAGSTTGQACSIITQGTDTNIDLALTPKGTGRIKFGTYTASVLTPTGYIEVLDSGGTLRRLLVG